MVNFIQLSAIILAGLAVAIADAFIKKTSIGGSFISALKSPLMILILLLYIAQIMLFVYVFTNNWQLGIVGSIQMIIYSIGVVLVGFLYFGESLSTIHIIGILLGLAGVILMNV